MRVGIRAGLSVDHLVHAGIGARYSQLGGPGLYATLGARLVSGTQPVFLDDLPASDERFASLFHRLGVDASAARVVDDVPALWILNAPEGRRVVSVVPPGIELDGGALSEVDSAPRVEVPGVDLDAVLVSNPSQRIRRPAARSTVGVDPDQAYMLRDGWTYLDEVTEPRDVLLPSRVHLTLIDDDPITAVKALAARLRVAVVARLDRDGMFVLTESRAWTLRDERVDVEETTGAGDASAAAIVAAMAAGYPVVEAAAFGMSVARIALSSWGAAALIEAAPLTAPLPDITTMEVSL